MKKNTDRSVPPGKRKKPAKNGNGMLASTVLVQQTAHTEPGRRARAGRKPSVSQNEAGETILTVQGGQKYKIGRLVAEGGMGVVHEATDLACRRVVALKALPTGRPVPPEDKVRFVEEAQITSQLEHPNIVPIHELGYDANQNVFYSMKYVRGVTLTAVLLNLRAGEKSFVEQYPLPRLLNVFQKVCDAIAFAHSKGVVHCDLKPENIMICDFGEVVVMDWGLARTLRSSGVSLASPAPEPAPPRPLAAGKKGTKTRILGTPGFIAPERVLDSNLADPKSDIYSLGATLYSILALRAPIKGGVTKELLRNILDGNIVPPADFNEPGVRDASSVPLLHCPDGKIPVALSDIAMKAMARDPADRYATVQELQQQVEAYQNGLIWHLVVDQDFKSPDALDRWEVHAGQHEIKNGELRIRYGEPQLLLYRWDLPGDVRIEFDCREETVYINSIGCFLSAVRSENRKEVPLTGYKFELGAFDNSLNVIERAGRQIATEAVSSIVRGQIFHVLAERVGARLRFVVNDREIFSLVDSDPLSGADRTAVGLFGWLAEMVISRVRIYTLGTPWKSDVLDIAERQTQKGHYDVAIALAQDVIDSHPEPARMERAQRTQETARRRQEMARQMPVWRERLEKAWNGAPFVLRMNNEGLSLDIVNAGIEDLTPLQGMPLTTLVCPFNRIQSLEPLRGMALVTFNCVGNPITSLEPLRGMPLNVLVCEGCPVESLEPLTGMSLSLLNAAGGRIESLEPLRGMSMSFLCCWGNRIRSLEPISGMKGLAALYCNGNQLDSLEPLRGMPLVTLNCSGNQITDLSPLQGMPLNVLHCGDNRIESLEPLKGMAIKMMSCQSNRIRSLEPLRGMALSSLTCGANLLTDIAPFLKTPPDDFRFDCDTISTKDLEWIHAAWSRDFRLAARARDVAVLLAVRRSNREELRKLATAFSGHHYLFVPKFLLWEEAKTFCEQYGGHLLTVSSQEENDFINAMFPTGSWFWLGLAATEKGYEWVTGEPLEYTNFVDLLQEGKGGPKIFSGRWTSDDVPHAHNSFMIEWDE